MTRKKSNEEKETPGAAQKRVVIITGAASGIGYDTALMLAKKGVEVYALVRRLESLGYLTESLASQGVEELVTPLHLDLTDENQREQISATLLERLAREDDSTEVILINNAGFTVMSSAEETSEAELKSVMDTNFYGAALFTRAFLPFMRSQKQGKIIQISSSYGRVGAPLMSSYVASKFALEGFSESLRHELLPFNVFVSLVEPGPVKTDFRSKIPNSIEWENSPYYPIYKTYDALLKSGKRWSSTSQEVAKVICRVALSSRPRLRYPVGKLAKLALKSSAWLPDSFQERMYRPRP